MYLDKITELVENKPVTQIMYTKLLLSKTAHMFKYKNLPVSMPAEEIEYILQTEGEGIVAEHNGLPYMYHAHPCDLADVYGNHHEFLITSVPHKRSDKVTTAENAVHWKNDSMSLGLLYQTLRYSEFIAEGDITIKKAMINARTPFVLSTNDEKDYQSALKFLKDIEEGKNAVLLNPEYLTSQGVDTKQWNLPGTSDITEILEAIRTMKSEFYSDLGVNINDNLKRSYVNEDDISAQNDASMHFLVNMLYQRKKAVERINELFGCEIEVEVNELWSGGVENERKAINGTDRNTGTEDKNMQEEEEVIQEETDSDNKESRSIEESEISETTTEDGVEEESILDDIYDETIESKEDIKKETEGLKGEDEDGGDNDGELELDK